MANETGAEENVPQVSSRRGTWGKKGTRRCRKRKICQRESIAAQLRVRVAPVPVADVSHRVRWTSTKSGNELAFFFGLEPKLAAGGVDVVAFFAAQGD
jgi:hypothetical protein